MTLPEFIRWKAERDWHPRLVEEVVRVMTEVMTGECVGNQFEREYAERIMERGIS